MRGKLKKMERVIMSALIVIEVHARDVVHKMVEEGVKNINDFEWISQLRWAMVAAGERRPGKMGVEGRDCGGGGTARDCEGLL